MMERIPPPGGSLYTGNFNPCKMDLIKGDQEQPASAARATGMVTFHVLGRRIYKGDQIKIPTATAPPTPPPERRPEHTESVNEKDSLK
ncbi:hypothetical protein chiPu_0010585 [Chiloscyllium punctatum]|uniref:Uncharacterized protein n=1 Tax=Chiloscyllium punctatum TaxID=137246 RepID=A0A401SNZ4_CHIPU|nr:hypothetical protein [Chiloscyllium punctatum]